MHLNIGFAMKLNMKLQRLAVLVSTCQSIFVSGNGSVVQRQSMRKTPRQGQEVKVQIQAVADLKLILPGTSSRGKSQSQ